MSRYKKNAQIDPKSLRKRSDVVKENENNIKVAGTREPTSTGYLVPGTKCPDYETFFQVIAEGQETDTVVHSAKFRSYRVLTGRGIAVLKKDDAVRTVLLVPGDELVMAPGISYKIVTDPRLRLEVLVTQTSNYSDELEVVAKSDTGVPDVDLTEVSREEVIEESIGMPRRRSGRNKAAEQQLEQAISRGKYIPQAPPVDTGISDSVGVNVKPTGGNFDWEGAG